MWVWPRMWECVCAVVPWPERALHLVCVFDSSIWVMGGQANAPAQTAFVRAPNSLSLSLSLSLPSEDLHADKGVLLQIKGEAGQFEPEGATELRDVWRSDNGADWTLVTDAAPWAPRGMITGAQGQPSLLLPAKRWSCWRSLVLSQLTRRRCLAGRWHGGP